MSEADSSESESLSRETRKQIKRTCDSLVDIAGEREHLQRLLESFREGNADGVRSVLEEASLIQNCRPICRVVCSWECSRVCSQLCPEPPQLDFSTEELVEISEGIGRLREQDQIQELVQVIKEEESEKFHAILEEAGLERFCHVICRWVCRIRCRVLCEQICRPEADREEATGQLRTTAQALSQLGSSPERLSQATEAIQNEDRGAFRSALEETEQMEVCRLLCSFLCLWNCFRRCGRLCRESPSIDFSVEELQQLGLGMCSLARNGPLLDRYIESFEAGETERFQEVLNSLQLTPFCPVLCWWTCDNRCRLICREVCVPVTICELDEPTGCTEDERSEEHGAAVVRVVGTADGANFDHYTLQLREVQGAECTDDEGWKENQDSQIVVYPGGGSTGTSPVRADTLGWIKTTHLQPDSYEIRLCIYTDDEQRSSCCCIQFRLFDSTVYIKEVGDAEVRSSRVFDPAAPVTDSGGQVVPVGGNVTVKGDAFVGDCYDRQVESFDVLYRPGHHPTPSNCNPNNYVGSLLTAHDSPLRFTGDSRCSEREKRARENDIYGPEDPLTVYWKQEKGPLGFKWCVLEDFGFSSHQRLPGCPDAKHLCQSGTYTLLLRVQDTAGNVYCDTQQVWFDNKPMHSDVHVSFDGIKGLPACEDLRLDEFGEDSCGSAWDVGLEGVAFDEYIDPNDRSYPSDNFDYYTIQVTRQGGPTLDIPIATSPGAYGPDPLRGTSRVGQPGVRCHDDLPSRCDSLKPSYPSGSPGLLSYLDLRVFDAQCAPQVPSPYNIPDGFPLDRGEECGYAFEVYAQDQTWSDGRHGGLHRAWSSPWAVTVVNNLPSP